MKLSGISDKGFRRLARVVKGKNSAKNPVVDENGNKKWFNNNSELHREDGPALEHTSGTKMWFINGELHREDGPAIKNPDGSVEYWLKGRPSSEEEVMGVEESDTSSQEYNSKDVDAVLNVMDNLTSEQSLEMAYTLVEWFDGDIGDNLSEGLVYNDNPKEYDRNFQAVTNTTSHLDDEQGLLLAQELVEILS